MLMLYIIGVIALPMSILLTMFSLPYIEFLPALGLLFPQGMFFFLTLALAQGELDRLKIGTKYK